MLTAIEPQRTGLHRPKDRSKMMLFIVLEMIWWGFIKYLAPFSRFMAEAPALDQWEGQHTPGNKVNNQRGYWVMFENEKMMIMVTMVVRIWKEMEYMWTGMYDVRRVDPHW
jgi:hypothetical protein